MSTYRYQFTTADGATCCASDDLALLCPHCRAAAALDPYAAARGAPAGVADDDARLSRAAAFRQAVRDLQTTSRRAAAQPSASDVHRQPPDPYRLALDREHQR
jgi:hypothetical protein